MSGNSWTTQVTRIPTFIGNGTTDSGLRLLNSSPTRMWLAASTGRAGSFTGTPLDGYSTLTWTGGDCYAASDTDEPGELNATTEAADLVASPVDIASAIFRGGVVTADQPTVVLQENTFNILPGATVVYNIPDLGKYQSFTTNLIWANTDRQYLGVWHRTSIGPTGPFITEHRCAINPTNSAAPGTPSESTSVEGPLAGDHLSVIVTNRSVATTGSLTVTTWASYRSKERYRVEDYPSVNAWPHGQGILSLQPTTAFGVGETQYPALMFPGPYELIVQNFAGAFDLRLRIIVESGGVSTALDDFLTPPSTTNFSVAKNLPGHPVWIGARGVGGVANGRWIMTAQNWQL